MGMYSLAFDLAARYSGAALLGPNGGLESYWTCDFGPLDKVHPQTNLRRVRKWAISVLLETSSATPEPFVTVENLSHYMTNPAPALRVQAVVLDRLDVVFEESPALLVLPAVWQNGLGWHKSKDSDMTSKTWAKWMCASLGYDVDPTPGSKAAEDARDAVLIARWRQLKEDGQIP
jgi:hypothetical protein